MVSSFFSLSLCHTTNYDGFLQSTHKELITSVSAIPLKYLGFRFRDTTPHDGTELITRVSELCPTIEAVCLEGNRGKSMYWRRSLEAERQFYSVSEEMGEDSKELYEWEWRKINQGWI